jgi:uncharacterized membrane protein
MSKEKNSFRKTIFVIALSVFLLGIAIFAIFGSLAGVFSPGKGLVESLTESVFGWVALFGATLFIFSPIILLTLLFLNRAIESAIEQQKNEKKNKSS